MTLAGAVRECCRENDWSLPALAKWLGIRIDVLTDILTGREPFVEQHARLLYTAFGREPAYWHALAQELPHFEALPAPERIGAVRSTIGSWVIA